jgi:SWIM zinc finger
MNMKQQTVKQIGKLTREDKALQLFQAGAVSKISDDMYHVKSQSQSQKNEKKEYEVIPSLGVCTCIDFERNGLPCKHVIATQIFRMSHIAAILTAAKIQTLNKIGVVITRV